MYEGAGQLFKFADLPENIVAGFVLTLGEMTHQSTAALQRNNHLVNENNNMKYM